MQRKLLVPFIDGFTDYSFTEHNRTVQSVMTVLLRSDVISDINWSSPQIVYDIFIRSEIRSYLQLLQDEINWI